MAKKIESFGFGFRPEEAQQHFLVVTPKGKRKEPQNVCVYERFVWDDAPEQVRELPPFEAYRQKVRLSQEKWNVVKSALEHELNLTLKGQNMKVGHFKQGQVPVERLLGKEMMVLLWAIEDCDPSVIPNAIRNWRGLSREERWWLFTMTNATTGDADIKRGWRIALRYAITDNPIPEKSQNRQGVLANFYQNM